MVSLTKQKGWILALAFCCVIILVATVSHATEPVTLQLKWKHQFQFAGYYAAINQGYYLEEGLDVILIEGKPGGKEVEEVLSGRADYGVGMSDILLSKFEGKSVVLLANIFQHSPVTLLATQKSGVTSPQDLVHKNIRMTAGVKSAELQTMFLNEGVVLSDLNISPPTWNIEDLISGEVDAIAAYVSSQPFVLKKRSIPYTLISPAIYGIDFYGDNLFTSEREIAEHPERAEAFRRASLKGWQYALENEEEIVELILSEYAVNNEHIDREFLLNEAAEYRDLILPQFVRIGHTNPGRWKHIADTYVRLGMAEKEYSFDGFFFESEEESFPWDHWVIKITLAITIVGVGGTLLLSFFNRRLKREMLAHQQTGKDLQESEEKFRALFEQSGGYCMVLDPNTPNGIPVIVDANEAACLVHGYERAEFIGRPVSDLDDEAGKTLVRQRTAEIMEGKYFYVENDHLRQDGTTFSVAVNAKRIDIGGKPPFILTTEYDITERKKAERELTEREEQYRAIAENSGDYIMRYDRNGRHIYANSNALEVTGLPEEQYIGKTHREMGFPMHLCELWKDNIESVFATGKSRSIEFDAEMAGGLMTFDLQLNPEFSKEGVVQTVIGISRDITRQKQLEVKLRQAQKMETIGTLAGGIAHDFNNILSSVLGFTELALDAVEKETRVEEDLREVYAAGLRAKDLVTQILTFARQSDENVKPIQIGPIVEEVLKFVRSTIPTTIEIRHNIESESLIMGNETQVHQIIMNLCNNAAHAMEDDGGILDVSLTDVTIDRSLRSVGLNLIVGDYVEIKVADTGMGIEPHLVEKIYDPYFTTKKTGEGTGMGLAMVHGIVETYKGKIFVKSTFGKGAEFTVYLPVCREKKRALQPATESLPQGQERVLVVDDEISITNINGRILSQLGYCVTTKNSSLEALELFRSSPNDFDLVVSDVTMPELAGDRLAYKLMQIRKDIPVILCTGYNKNIANFSDIEMGIKALIQKPIVKTDLAIIVREVLDKAKESAQVV